MLIYLEFHQLSKNFAITIVQGIIIIIEKKSWRLIYLLVVFQITEILQEFLFVETLNSISKEKIFFSKEIGLEAMFCEEEESLKCLVLMSSLVC